jgi:hypothetical protein
MPSHQRTFGIQRVSLRAHRSSILALLIPESLVSAATEYD